MKHQPIKFSVQSFSAAVCLSLAFGFQALAEQRLQPNHSIYTTPAATSQTNLKQDTEITPAACTDSCSGSRCCEATCCPKRVTEEVKKHCWKVKSEMVCIPGFRFQCTWNRDKGNNANCNDCCTTSSCCDANPPTCGRVRCIRVLEKHEYTCEECGYEWDVKGVRTSKGRCCGEGGCSCPSCGSQNDCCAQSTLSDSEVRLTSAEDALPEAASPEHQSVLGRWTKLLRR